MRNRIRIESLGINGGMGGLSEILAQSNIDLVAVGSMACIGTIEAAAKRLEAEERVFVRGLTAKDYALGKNSRHIRELLEIALKRPQTKGIIVYCSCLEVLTNLDEEDILEQLANEQNIPIAFLYRGPLVKRRSSPRLALNKIWQQWGITLKPPRERLLDLANNAIKVDFGEAILKQSTATNILVITPGGCISCLHSIPNIEGYKVFGTRFDDLVLSSLEPSLLVEAIEAYFSKREPILLLGTAVLKVTGLALAEVCQELCRKGFSASYLATDVFRK